MIKCVVNRKIQFVSVSFQFVDALFGKYANAFVNCRDKELKINSYKKNNRYKSIKPAEFNVNSFNYFN